MRDDGVVEGCERVCGVPRVPRVPSPLILLSSFFSADPSSADALSSSLSDLQRKNLIRNPESTNRIQRVSECPNDLMLL